MKRQILAVVVLISIAMAGQSRGAGDRLYGVHWWDYSNPTTGIGPDNGWSVESIVTNSATWWQAPYFAPLYQGITGSHNGSIITRVDYDWGQTVPATSTITAQNWATNVVNNVVTPLGAYSTRWVIGNEPNLVSEGTGWATSQITPAGYAQIYTAVRQAIKAVRPQDEVIFAPVSPGPVIAGVRWKEGNQWLSEAIDATLALPNGGIDGFALHAYGGQSTAVASTTEFHTTYTSQLAVIDARSILQNKPVYITEWNRATPTTGSLAANEQITADFISQSLVDVDNWNRVPGNHNIRAMAWFVANKDYGDWNQYSLEWWQTRGNALGNPGDMWTALMNKSSLKAGVVGQRASGDFNGDGVVNSSDHAAWRNAFGSTNNPYVDGNRSGSIDAGDYVLWRKTSPAATGTGLESVPEPIFFWWVVVTAAVACIMGRYGARRVPINLAP